MNYAAMIEEKNLKKTFIIATLCSTLVGTFTSSIGLWDRVKSNRKQTVRDTAQDEEIKKLKSQVEEAEKLNKAHRDPYPRDPYPRDRYPRDPYMIRDRVGDSLERSGALISREFDDGYERFGRRFAVGNSMTENKLQAQIISLQQTVINVLQDAVFHGRRLDRQDMAQLIAASDAARDRSLDALREQRQTLMLEAPKPPPSTSQRSVYNSPPRSSSSSSSSSATQEAPQLFCRYSQDLQHKRNKALSTAFAPSGDSRCPACSVQVDVEPDDCWVIEKRGRARVREQGRSKDVLEEREFKFGQRFVVKCHMPDGRFACIMCSRFREKDMVCKSVEALVDHMGRDHDSEELEREEDFEVRSRVRSLPRALPSNA